MENYLDRLVSGVKDFLSGGAKNSGKKSPVSGTTTKVPGTKPPATSAATAGVSGGSRGASGLDDYGNTDYSKAWEAAKGRGAEYDELAKIAADREYKASTKAGYGSYQKDDTQKAMDDYLRRIGSSSSGAVSFDQYKKDMEYNAGGAAEQAAIDAAVSQTVNGLNGQKSGVTQSAEEMARQAYISYMQANEKMPQALSAAGYSGGMADSQRLELENGLRTQQGEIAQNKANTLNDIETAINNARLSGNVESARAQADLGREALNAYQQYKMQQQAMENQNFWNKYGYDFQAMENQSGRDFTAGERLGSQDWQGQQNEKQWAQSEKMDTADKLWQSQQNQNQWNQQQTASDLAFQQKTAWENIWSGILPGDDLLAAAGISREDAQRYVNEVQSQKTASQKTRGTTVGRSGYDTGGYDMDEVVRSGRKVSQGMYDQAAELFDSGVYTADVIDTLLSAEGETSDNLARAAGMTASPGGLGTGPVSSQYVAQQVAAGNLLAVEIGGKVYYKWVTGQQPTDGMVSPQIPKMPGALM